MNRPIGHPDGAATAAASVAAQLGGGRVFIAGLGTWLPAAVTTAEAIASGGCDPAVARSTDVQAVTIDESELVPAEMAVRAAGSALRQARIDPAAIAAVFHAYLFDQGNQLWSAPSYVARRALGSPAPAFGVQQVSNGGMAALRLAGAYLRADPTAEHALVTTADRFSLPGFHRWHSDPGTVYADGGTALVLSRMPGFAELKSLAMVSDPELEGMHRAGEAAGPGLRVVAQPVDLGGCKAAYLKQVGSAATLARIAEGQRGAMELALAAAGSKLGDIDRFVLPHFGIRRLRSNYLRHLDIDESRTNWEFSRQVGHLGAGDQVASLAHLLRTGALRPGQRCLLFAVGAGFTWSCAVVEIHDRPRPAADQRPPVASDPRRLH